jgi:heme O synthase-like polyprenyltransferase
LCRVQSYDNNCGDAAAHCLVVSNTQYCITMYTLRLSPRALLSSSILQAHKSITSISFTLNSNNFVSCHRHKTVQFSSSSSNSSVLGKFKCSNRQFYKPLNIHLFRLYTSSIPQYSSNNANIPHNHAPLNPLNQSPADILSNAPAIQSQVLANLSDPAALSSAALSSAAVKSKQEPIRRSKSALRYYFKEWKWAKLCKFDLSIFASMSVLFGYYLSGGLIAFTPQVLLTISELLGGTLLCAFAASIKNQIKEIDFDKLMIRTRMRPLVTGTITVPQATAAHLVFTGAGMSLLYAASGSVLSPALGLLTILSYAHIYTPLKRKTIYNTEVGALVGALPVFIGSSINIPLQSYFPNATLPSISSFLRDPTHYIEVLMPLCQYPLLNSAVCLGYFFMALWQMPHFMQICCDHAADYMRAGYIMRSNQDVELISNPNNPSIKEYRLKTGQIAASVLYGAAYSLVMTVVIPLAAFAHNLVSPLFLLTFPLASLILLNGSYTVCKATKEGKKRPRAYIYIYFVVAFALICMHSTANTFVDGLLRDYAPWTQEINEKFRLWLHDWGCPHRISQETVKPISDHHNRALTQLNHTNPGSAESAEHHRHMCVFILGKEILHIDKATTSNQPAASKAQE